MGKHLGNNGKEDSGVSTVTVASRGSRSEVQSAEGEGNGKRLLDIGIDGAEGMERRDIPSPEGSICKGLSNSIVYFGHENILS